MEARKIQIQNNTLILRCNTNDPGIPGRLPGKFLAGMSDALQTTPCYGLHLGVKLFLQGTTGRRRSSLRIAFRPGRRRQERHPQEVGLKMHYSEEDEQNRSRT